MPNVLDETDVDVMTESIDSAIDEESWHVGPTDGTPDLSNGGMVNGVRVRPSRDKTVRRGRAAARRAWMWNGTESLLPLAWDADGRVHDGARRYLRKRYCLCCATGGFQPPKCPRCSNIEQPCTRCGGSTDRKKIIPCFYLRLEDVPFPTNVYGSIPCFLPFCQRRGSMGFKSDEEMRLHARSRHRTEYQAHMDSVAANKVDEVTELRSRLDALMSSMAMKNVQDQTPPTAEAPLYVPEKKPQAQRRGRPARRT